MITIVDTGGSNLSSVINAIDRLAVKWQITTDPDTITNSPKVLLPGVGAAKSSMDKIKAHELDQVLASLSQPTFGICLGMQLLFSKSEEGDTPCLDIIPGVVSRIKAPELPLPHMGWNQLTPVRESLLLKGVEPGSYVYFVHTYQGPVDGHTVATIQYGNSIPAMVEKDNYFGAQFHPEKSALVGQTILRNFIEL